MEFDYFKLEIFIPQTHFSQLQETLQKLDAGHIGNYDSCLSYSSVQSTWRPLEGCKPYIGTPGQLSQEAEYKVEVTIKSQALEDTLWHIRAIHPYEEPVINVIPLYSVGITQSTTEKHSDAYRQYRFDDSLNIICESAVREMSQAEREEYDRLVAGSTQLSLEDFL